jgi:hypothetical protein
MVKGMKGCVSHEKKCEGEILRNGSGGCESLGWAFELFGRVEDRRAENNISDYKYQQIGET